MRVIAHRARFGSNHPNRPEGLRGCIERGIDAVEVDVRLHDEVLILSHDAPATGEMTTPVDAILPDALHLDFLMLDVKHPAAAAAAARWIGDKGLRNACVATTNAGDVDSIRAAFPTAVVSLSFPEDRPSVSGRPSLKWVVDAFLLLSRFTLPLLIVWWAIRYRPQMFTLYRRVVSQAAVWVAEKLKRRVYVWTVDDHEEARRMARWGISGIITNDPLRIRADVDRTPDLEP